MKKLYVLLYVFFALIFCIAVYYDNILLRTITKPIPLLILIFSLKPTSHYKKFILAGFILSLAGDIFLLKILDLFILGLASFLLAHIAYIVAFVKRSKKIDLISFTISYAIATVLAYLFFPHLGDMFVPVIVYIYVIITMVWRAYMQRKYNKAAVFALIGAVLFAISDTNIAYTKFIQDYNFSKIVTIILYWSSQFLIAKSAFTVRKK